MILAQLNSDSEYHKGTIIFNPTRFALQILVSLFSRDFTFDLLYTSRDLVFLTQRKPWAPLHYHSSFIVYNGVAREITHFRRFCADLAPRQTSREPPSFDGVRDRSIADLPPPGAIGARFFAEIRSTL